MNPLYERPVPVVFRNPIAHEAAITTWCQEALDFLERPEATIAVEAWGFASLPAPRGKEASSNATGIALHRSLLTGPLHRLRFLLFEEIAHVILHREGVPAGEAVAEFFHEVFATWAQFEGLINTGRISRSQIRTAPITRSDARGDVPYMLGKHLGGALAGHEPNRRHFEAWLTSFGTQPEWQALATVARAARDNLSSPLTTDAVLMEYRRAEAAA